MAVVKLENVSKSWGDFKAVDDFNLTIEDEEFLVLLGVIFFFTSRINSLYCRYLF